MTKASQDRGGPRPWRLALMLGFSLAAHGAAAWYLHPQGDGDRLRHSAEARVLALEVMRAPVTAPATADVIPEPAAIPAASNPQPALPAPKPDPVRAVWSAPVSDPVPVVTETQAAREPAPVAVAFAAATPVVEVSGLRDSYRELLMRHLEGYKYYPSAARRLRMEGSVRMRLVVDCRGQVQEQVVEEGIPLLAGAAHDSVERAQPLPAPPEGLGCPHTLRYAMRYALSDGR